MAFNLGFFIGFSVCVCELLPDSKLQFDELIFILFFVFLFFVFYLYIFFFLVCWGRFDSIRNLIRFVSLLQIDVQSIYLYTADYGASLAGILKKNNGRHCDACLQ